MSKKKMYELSLSAGYFLQMSIYRPEAESQHGCLLGENSEFHSLDFSEKLQGSSRMVQTEQPQDAWHARVTAADSCVPSPAPQHI